MKIRTDFVSNSSSSSFIVAAEDNKYMLLLPKAEILTFKEYFDKFGDREIDLSYYGYNDKHVSYVPDSEFVNKFLDSISRLIPISVKAKHKEYIKLNEDLRAYREGKDFNNTSVIEDTLYDELHALYDLILNDIYLLLSKKYSNMMFCYEEVDDNEYYSSYSDIDDDDGIMSNDNANPDKVSEIQEMRKNKFIINIDNRECYSDEDLYLHRINYIDSIIPLKFCRRYSNH